MEVFAIFNQYGRGVAWCGMACLLFEIVNVKAKIGVLERLKHLSALVIIIAYGIGEGGGRLTVHWGITSRVNRSDSDEIWVGEY